MIEPKQQIDECSRRLYDSRSDLTCETLLRLAALELSVLDRRTRRCQKDELERLQGEIAVWEKLQKYIQNAPVMAKNLT